MNIAGYENFCKLINQVKLDHITVKWVWLENTAFGYVIEPQCCPLWRLLENFGFAVASKLRQSATRRLYFSLNTEIATVHGSTCPLLQKCGMQIKRQYENLT